jgi:hypothetical protein
MALILLEGFDAYATASGQDISDTILKYYGVSDESHAYRSFSSPHGGYSFRILTSSTSHFLYMTPPGREVHPTWIVGFNFYNPSGGLATSAQFLRLAQQGQAGAGDSVGLRIGTNNKIEIRDGADSVLASTANNAFTQGTWHHMEFKAYCHASAGTVELKIDGSTVASASGLDTDYSGTPNFNKLILSSPGSVSFAPAIDDLYICDGSGSKNNDFLGQCYIETLYPTSDAGPNAGAPSSGIDNYAMVDEVPVDDSSSYVTLTANGDREMYGYPALSSGGSVVGLGLITVSASKSASGAKLKGVAKSGASEVSPTAKEVAGGGYYHSNKQISETNPDTSSSWTASEVDGGTFGYELET